MKLWQRVFLLTLLLIMISVTLVSVMLMRSNFKLTLENAREQALSAHSYIYAEIKNNVSYTRLKQGSILLSEDEIKSSVSEVMRSSKDERLSTLLLDDKGERIAENGQNAAFESSFRDSFTDGTFSVMQKDNESGHYFVIGSDLTLEGKEYVFVSSTDITDIYDNLHNEAAMSVIIAAASSLCAAFVVLLSVYRMLSPIAGLNSAIAAIAAGDYTKRVETKGSTELSELGESVNIMAQSIEEKVEKLSALAESRKDFADNLAHEMKTPLTSILGFSDLLRIRKNISERDRMEYAGIVVEEAKRLRALSGKLLELVTTEEAELEFTEIYLPDLFREISVSVVPILAKRHEQLKFYAEKVYIRADGELFKSLIYNLIDNASKASAEGQEIRLYSKFSNGTLAIAVSDDGIGMSEKEAKRVTEPFYMVDKSRSRKAGGAGIGLALCSRIAEKHNAVLKIKSIKGKGTTVTITLAAKEGKR